MDTRVLRGELKTPEAAAKEHAVQRGYTQQLLTALTEAGWDKFELVRCGYSGAEAQTLLSMLGASGGTDGLFAGLSYAGFYAEKLAVEDLAYFALAIPKNLSVDATHVFRAYLAALAKNTTIRVAPQRVAEAAAELFVFAKSTLSRRHDYWACDS